MSHTHHPHLFSHEWLDLHPALVRYIKLSSTRIGVVFLIAIAALLVVKLELEPNVPLKIGTAIIESAVKSSYPDYLPNQFYMQQKQAPVEGELPAQF